MTNITITDPLIKGTGTQNSTKVEASAKEKNYTDAQADEMRELYNKYPCVDTVMTIAKSFNKSKRSVIAKLSNMKIYVTPPRTTKAGGVIVKKATLVEQIGLHLDITVLSLEKSNKADLEKVLHALEDYLGPLDIAV